MRKSSRWLTTFYSVLLAAGLFCAQVCQVVCVTAACADEAQAAKPAPQPEHGHCHQHNQTAKPPAESLPHAPTPSHDCQKHPVLQSLPPDNQLVKAGPHADRSADGNASLIVVTFAHAPATIHPLPRSLFKPPPRSWLTTVQRI